MERTVAVINRAPGTVRVKLDNTAAVDSDRNPDELGVLLLRAAAELVAVLGADVARLGDAAKVGLAVEHARGVPAGALDGEGAAVARVVAGRVVARGGVVVDGIAVVVDDGEAAVVPALGAGAGPADGREAARGPDHAEVLGVGGGGEAEEPEEEVADGRHCNDDMCLYERCVGETG